MKLRGADLVLLALAAGGFVLSALLGTRMPARMVIHWNAAGQPDGYASRAWGLYGVPCLGVALGLLFVAIPRIDPLRENIRQFATHYYRLAAIVLAFLLAVHGYVLVWNAGCKLPISNLMVPCLAVLLFYAGHVCERSRPNWFVGVRTPWTLSSPAVWEKSNRLAGRLFKACGLLSLLGLVCPRQAAWIVLGPVLVAAVAVIVHSYVSYEKQLRRGDG